MSPVATMWIIMLDPCPPPSKAWEVFWSLLSLPQSSAHWPLYSTVQAHFSLWTSGANSGHQHLRESCCLLESMAACEQPWHSSLSWLASSGLQGVHHPYHWSLCDMDSSHAECSRRADLCVCYLSHWISGWANMCNVCTCCFLDQSKWSGQSGSTDILFFYSPVWTVSYNIWNTEGMKLYLLSFRVLSTVWS